MPTFKSFAAFGAELARLTVDLTTDEKAEITQRMGREARKIADAEAARDLGGDRAFSGWRRRGPIPLNTKLTENPRGSTTLHPTKRSAGPWTVAEQGRHQGGTTSFLGPGVNRETGETARTKSGRVRKVRAFKAKRWNGYTDGKGTAVRAVSQMEKKIPKVADREVRRVIQRRFDVT